MITSGLVVGCVICQLTAASNGVEISLLCVIVKLLMGFNCERWTDDMGDLRNFSFHYPSGSLQSHNQCVVLFLPLRVEEKNIHRF
ncbi:hypothetical protein T08_7990 [Trichinella sp. T8]|nr:hypothetical protein T08_7990 [Trichinella sp. T8]